MVSFAELTLTGEGPIYDQIADYVRRGVAGGTIRDGEELPSRRVLSALLGVNPNTIQKACRLLEEEGLIVSRAGAKSFISAAPEQVELVRWRLMRQDAARAAAALKGLGLQKEQALSLLAELWDKEGET